jgi:hypothetical protein
MKPLILYRINWFSDFVHHPDSKELEDRKHDVSETICFRPQVRGDTYGYWGSLSPGIK